MRGAVREYCLKILAATTQEHQRIQNCVLLKLKNSCKVITVFPVHLVFHLESSEDKGAKAIRYGGNYYLAVDTEGKVKLCVSQVNALKVLYAIL